MTKSRSERMHRSLFARKRRGERRRICIMCTLREWARKHRLRVKGN